MASGGRLMANSNASAVRVSGKWCEKSAVSEARSGRNQAYRVPEI